MLSTCDCLPETISDLLKQHLRIIVIGLLGFSGFMVLSRNSFIKFLVLLGYLILSYSHQFPITQVPPLSDNAFYENLVIIGGIIYLMGADRPLPSSS